MTPEAKVKKKVRDTLGTIPNCWFFMPPANGYGRAGIPDFVGCYRGFFFAIECKAGDNKLTALQERELEGINKANGMTWVVTDNNVGHFKDLLGSWFVDTNGG